MSEGDGSVHIGGGSQSGSKMSRKFALKQGNAPLFGALAMWEATPFITPMMTYLGLLIEAAQVVSMAFNPHFRYEFLGSKEAAYALFALHVPLWDQRYVTIDYYPYLAIFAAVLLLLGVTVVLAIATITGSLEQRASFANAMVKYALHSVSTWGYYPILHILLAVVFCSDGHVWTFPKQQCWQVDTGVIFIIAICGFIVTIAIGLVMSSTMGDTTIGSPKYLARSHLYCDVWATTFKVSSVLLFHLLVGSKITGAYAVLLFFGAASVSLSYAYFLPHRNHAVNRFRCIVYGVTAFVSLVNIGGNEGEPYFAHNHLTSYIVFAMAPLVAFVCVCIADSRINPQLTYYIRMLHTSATVPQHTAQFPYSRGETQNDLKLISSRFRGLEAEIVAELGDAPDDFEATEEAVNTSTLEVLVPYVTEVYTATDVELATRFLFEFNATTNISPTCNMVAFATRTYLKALMLFKKSDMLKVLFGNFLFTVVSRVHLAGELADEVMSQDGNLIVLYASYKLSIRVKAMFGQRDQSYLHSYHRAKRFHKEVLASMAMFWGKLAEEKADLVALATLTNSITWKRDEGRKEYLRALRDQEDRMMLTLYASFLESVMMDQTAADEYKRIAEEIAEEKKNRMMHGARSKAELKAMTKENKHLRTLAQKDQEDQQELTGNQSLMKATTIGLGVIALLALGHFALQLAFALSQDNMLSVVHSSAVVRTASQQCGQYAMHAGNVVAECPTCEVELQGVLTSLVAAEAEMRGENNKVTYGSLSNFGDDVQRYDPVFSLYTRADMLFRENKGGDNLEVDFDATGAWNLQTELSTVSRELVNKAMLMQPIDREVSYVRLSVPSTHASQFDRTVAAWRSGQKRFQDLTLAGSALIFAVICSLLLVTYLVFMLNLQNIGSSKIVVLKLFSLIPYNVQSAMYNAGKTKIESFELLETEEEEGKADNDLAPDDDDDDDLSDEQEVEVDRVSGERTRSFQGHDDDKKLSLGFDDDDRRMSRAPPQMSGAMSFLRRRSNEVRSILKRPGVPARKKRRRVRFKDVPETDAPKHRLLKEPEMPTSNPDVINDLEQIIKEAKEEEDQEIDEEKRKRDQETEKLIQNVLRTTSTDDTTDTDNLTAVFSTLSSLLVFAIAVSAGAMIVMAMLQGDQTRDERLRGLEGVQGCYSLQEAYRNLQDHGTRFVHSGDRTKGAAFFDDLTEDTVTNYQRAVAHHLVGPEVSMVGSADGSYHVVQKIIEKAMRLAAAARNMSSGDLPLLFEVGWPSDYSLSLTSSATLLASTPEHQQAEANRLVKLKKVAEGTASAESALYHLRTSVEERKRGAISSARSQQHLYTYAAMGLLVVSGFTMLYIKIWQQKGHSAVMKALFVFALIATLINIGMMGYEVYVDGRPQIDGPMFDALAIVNASWAAYHDQHHWISNFVVFGDKIDEFRFLESRSSMPAAAMIQSQLVSLIASSPMPANAVPPAVVDSLVTNLQRMEAIENAALLIAVSATGGEVLTGTGLATVPPTYDVTTEYRFSEEQFLYEADSPELQYHSSHTDLHGRYDKATLNKIAKHALFGLRGSDHMDRVNADFQTLKSSVYDAASAAIVAEHKDAHELLLVQIGIAGAAACIVLFSVLIDLVRTIAPRSSQSPEVALLVKSLYNGVALKCVVSLSVIGVVALAQFVVFVVFVYQADTQTELIDVANAREQLVSLSMTEMEILSHHWLTSSTPLRDTTQSRRRLDKSISQLTQKRNQLAFEGEEHISEQQKTLTFTGDTSLDRQYQAWLNKLDDVVAASQLSAGSKAQSVADFQATLAMREAVGPLLQILRRSNELYVSDGKTITGVLVVPVIVIAAVLIVSVIGLAYFVFRPLVTQLGNEEEGTKLLLRMIPQKVREAVPKIGLYLDQGVVLNEQLEISMHKQSDTTVEFLRGASRYGSRSDAYAVLERTQTHGIVTITTAGIIQFTNSAFLQLSDYSKEDVIGQNVMMLMDEPLRSLHDSFLQNYHETGNSRILGSSRDVLLLTADGTSKHVYLYINEARFADGDTEYVGTFQEYRLNDLLAANNL